MSSPSQPIGAPQPSATPAPAAPRKSRTVLWVATAAVVAVVVVTAVLFLPATSPFQGVRDSDGDGIADDADAFPDDPSESKDSDGDGVGDNSDAFPNDPSETRDSDGDGVGDNADRFPDDPTQWADRDGDGYGDNPSGLNPDAFPNDPTEWRDSDSDGVGDNADFYDSGNGRIRLRVTYIAVGSDCDFFSACDPFFVFAVDADLDGSYESTKTSAVTPDTNVITNPNDAFFIVDIPDGATSIKFYIQAWDSDVTGQETIDYVPGSGSYYIHTVPNPFSDSWSYQGSGGSYNARLDYEISVIG